MNSDASSHGKQVSATVLYGLVVVILYGLLYLFEDRILEVSSRGGWHFLVPVAIAFLFSFVHGSFTGHFWDLLGFKAKK